MELVLFLAVLVALVAAPAAAQPTITITSPRNGDSLASSTLVVEGTATNAIRVGVCIDGVPCADAVGISSWSATIDLTSLSDGTHQIQACAYDAAGSKACASIQLSLSRNYQVAESTLETIAVPGLLVAGLIVTAIGAFVPRLNRVGDGVAAVLGISAVAALAIRLTTAPFSTPLAVAAVLTVAALAVRGPTRSVRRGGRS